MRTWFSSDHHFGHANVIRYCGRPYADVDEMNRDMVRRWNDSVGPRDVVYYLGDFAMGAASAWAGFRERLQGRLILVRGNHDRAAKFMVEEVGFESAVDNVVVTVDGVRLWLNHYPPAADRSDVDHRGRQGYVRPLAPEPYDVALCGHVHQLWRIRDGVINVGVDRWSFAPISLGQVLEAQGR